MAERALDTRSASPPSLRIDKFLWYIRIARSRTFAQALAQQGVIRLNGRRVERAHTAVRVGDLITVPQGAHVQVLRILAMPERRGPPGEAEQCYELLELGSDNSASAT
jgi:ribosome-associated heat shock protein Hsp15